MNIFVDMFLVFFKIGLFTFGGGYSMLPIIKKEVVDDKKWISMEEVMDFYAISQCTPGVIAINTSVFIGNHIKNFWGGVFCSLGVITPSVIIIILIASFISNFNDIIYVQLMFNGIRIAVSALIVNATIIMYKKGVVDIYSFFIFVASFISLYYFEISPIIIVFLFAIIGVVISILKSRK
ncbi:MAG: chromate transporter [Erysipelotrichaceae bacterium]